MSKVFVLHEPARWDGRRMVPFDLSAADRYGERVVVFPGGDRPPPAQEALPALECAMRSYTRADYLLVAGDMDLLVWASVLALRNTSGMLNLLRWNNRSRRYECSSAPQGLWI